MVPELGKSLPNPTRDELLSLVVCRIGDTPHARLPSCPENCSLARNGFDPRGPDEKIRTRAMHFGNLNKTDFLIPPFALFYFYTVFAAGFNLPLFSTREFFQSEGIAGRSRPVLRWREPVASQSRFIWEEFSRWHRCRPSRQAGHDGYLCRQSQSDLRGICVCVAWATLGVPELGFIGLPHGRHLAVPPVKSCAKKSS